MGRWLSVAGVVAACTACGPGGAKGAGGPERDLGVIVDPRVFELVSVEAERSFERLDELSASRDPGIRTRATQALGRLGGDRARDRLDQLLGDADQAVRDQAVWSLGVANAEDREQALIDLFGSVVGARSRAVVVRALGKIGSQASLGTFASALQDGSPEVREAAAVALGVLGRRTIALNDAARSALVASLGHRSPAVRFGIAYALAREHKPTANPKLVQALASLAADRDAEVRATALFGLAQRDGFAASVFSHGLQDPDWRVRLQAVMALASKSSTPELRAELSVMLAREWALLARARYVGPRIHVVAEGLRALAPFAGETMVSSTADGLFKSTGATLAERKLLHNARLAASMVHCLAANLRAQGGTAFDDLWDCGGAPDKGWPLHERRALAAALLVDANAGDWTGRSARLQAMFTDGDPRVRATALVALTTIAGDIKARPLIDKLAERGLEDAAIEVAGSAADLVAAIVKAGTGAAKPKAMPGDGSTSSTGTLAPPASLLAALVARAQREAKGDVELRLTLLSAIRDAAVAGGLDVCRRAHSDSNVTLRRTARECIEALTKDDPGAGNPESPPTPPPAKPGGLLGKRVLWTVVTTKGEIRIALDPDTAPWHVATVVALTDKKFYDGLLWHRVVPNFVVQGGSPSNSAWGGPGFVVPGEPSDGTYRRGTVGIADAGMDTGGSQWFIMHSRAPHLDGRYTIIGQVTSGVDVVDALVVGDRIVKATVRVSVPSGAGSR